MTKTFFSGVCLLSLWTALAGAVSAAEYVPPIVSNGEVSFALDRTCATPESESEPLLSSGIFRAGRRQSHPARELLPQGRFFNRVKIDGALRRPDRSEQELDLARNGVVCRNFFGEIAIESFVFVADFHGESLIVVRQRIDGGGRAKTEVESRIEFVPPVHERMAPLAQSDSGEVRVYEWQTYGYHVWRSAAAVYQLGSDWIIHPADSLEGRFSGLEEEPVKRIREGWQWNRTHGVDELEKEHVAQWRRFCGESAVKVPDAKIQRLVEVAAYHLKANATRWSYPVGIFNSHWQGLFFGFDSMYQFQGLASGGHFALSAREPEYRFATIGPARSRVGYYGPQGDWGALWFWESLEEGDSEGTVPGFWMQHVFHEANIARCAYLQYRYTRDRGWFVRCGYPVLLDCARFFRRFWVYEDGPDAAYVGKCTDLERLGPARERPFMTTCGAIWTLRSAAAASAELGTNLVEAADFAATAERLVKGLPTAGDRYACDARDSQVSVALLAGLDPYPVFGRDNLRQRNAAWHFLTNSAAGGNMYPTGKRVCPWYAAKMASALETLGDRRGVIEWLHEVAASAGEFGEYWEINEPEVRSHAWFATAAGATLAAVHGMLVKDVEAGPEKGTIELAYTVPASWREYSFTLPSLQGVELQMKVVGGKLSGFAVRRRPGAGSQPLSFAVRPDLVDGVELSRFGLMEIARSDDRVLLRGQ